MKNFRAFFIMVATLVFFMGCSDHRLDRSDEEAMMVYRECMNDHSPQPNSAGMTATITNAKTADPNTSIAANTQTQQEQNQHLRCAQLAGYERH